ncbi:MAG: hypothetical protein JSV24_03745 [Bacteroidales bacterium]|nr:MAG: hypothetical protein JSV24_03745 [Bacteroidales bacterium]
MKTIIRMLFLYGIISIMAVRCERDKSMEINKEIIGDWVNTINNEDILFINDTLISRIDTQYGEPYHHYNYTILSPDSIKMQYRGRYLIWCPETTFHMSLDQQEMILTIENLNTYFPEYPGDTFKKIAD